MYEEPHRWEEFPPEFRALPAPKPAEGKAAEDGQAAESASETDFVEGSVVGEGSPPPGVSGVESPAEPLPTPAYSAAQKRDRRLLQVAMHCEEHETVLRELASAGRTPVNALAARLGIGQKKLSRYLRELYVAGLVDRQQVGKFAWYEAIPERVELQRHPGGLFSLKVRRGNVSITFATEAPELDATETR